MCALLHQHCIISSSEHARTKLTFLSPNQLLWFSLAADLMLLSLLPPYSLGEF